MTKTNESKDFVIRINRNTVFVVAIAIAVLLSTYSLGKASNQVKSTPQPTPTLTPIPSPTPTQSPAVVYQKSAPTPKPTPTPEAKVSISIDDNGGFTKGTFYCFQSKVNELAGIQNQIRNKEITSDSCFSSHSNEIANCSMNCSNGDNNCSHNCAEPFLQQCGSYEVGNLRQELSRKVKEYCP